MIVPSNVFHRYGVMIDVQHEEDTHLSRPTSNPRHKISAVSSGAVLHGCGLEDGAKRGGKQTNKQDRHHDATSAEGLFTHVVQGT